MSDLPETRSPVSEISETEAALKRLLGSERFRKNASLRALFEYLIGKTLNGEGDRIKETTVAMDVFGRSQDFDSRIDNIVRVQAHRLRKLLAAYYEAEGAGELIRFSLPKGGYVPHIEDRVTLQASLPRAVVGETAGLAGEPTSLLAAVPSSSGLVRRWTWLPWAAFLLGVLVAGLAVSWWNTRHSASTRPAVIESTSALGELWAPLLRSSFPCVVSYSNPVFIAWGTGTGPRTLIPYRGPISAPTGAKIDISPAELGLDGSTVGPESSFYYNDSWTGVGEVMAIQSLTALVAPSTSMRVLRSRALTYGDLQGNNVVFLGSAWANDMQNKINVRAMPLMNDNSGDILNLLPKPGEPPAFRAQLDPGTRQISSTYGLFSVLPGATAGTRVYISAGVNTYGTGITMQYMTSREGAQALRAKLSSGGKARLPPYLQVVIRAEMIRSEPANPQIVLVRELTNAGPSTVR